VFLGFNIHAFIPLGQEHGGEGIAVERAAEMLDVTDSEDSNSSIGFNPGGGGGGGNGGPESEHSESSHSDGDGGGAPPRRVRRHQGHFIAEGNPVPLGLLVEGPFLDRREFIVQGGAARVENEDEEGNEEEEFDIDRWLAENPQPLEADRNMDPDGINEERGYISEDSEVGSILVNRNDEERGNIFEDSEVGSILVERNDDERHLVAEDSDDEYEEKEEEEHNFEAWEADAERQRVEMNVNPAVEYGTHRGSPGDGEESDARDPRQGDVSTVQVDEGLYGECSGRSGPPALLEKLGPEDKIEEEQDLEIEDDSAAAHGQFPQDELRQEQSNEEEDGNEVPEVQEKQGILE
jgi:hypothetical protein